MGDAAHAMTPHVAQLSILTSSFSILLSPLSWEIDLVKGAPQAICDAGVVAQPLPRSRTKTVIHTAKTTLKFYASYTQNKCRTRQG
jgi:hypothetical protein